MRARLQRPRARTVLGFWVLSCVTATLAWRQAIPHCQVDLDRVVAMLQTMASAVIALVIAVAAIAAATIRLHIQRFGLIEPEDRGAYFGTGFLTLVGASMMVLIAVGWLLLRLPSPGEASPSIVYAFAPSWSPGAVAAVLQCDTVPLTVDLVSLAAAFFGVFGLLIAHIHEQTRSEVYGSRALCRELEGALQQKGVEQMVGTLERLGPQLHVVARDAALGADLNGLSRVRFAMQKLNHVMSSVLADDQFTREDRLRLSKFGLFCYAHIVTGIREATQQRDPPLQWMQSTCESLFLSLFDVHEAGVRNNIRLDFNVRKVLLELQGTCEAGQVIPSEETTRKLVPWLGTAEVEGNSSPVRPPPEESSAGGATQRGPGAANEAGPAADDQHGSSEGGCTEGTSGSA